MHYKVWDEITNQNPFPNFCGATVGVWEWISAFISHFAGHVNTHPGLLAIDNESKTVLGMTWCQTETKP